MTNNETTQQLKRLFGARGEGNSPSSLVEVEHLAVRAGELALPSVKEVTLALVHHDHSVALRNPYPVEKLDLPMGVVSLCPFDTAFSYELLGASDFSVALLRNQALQEALENDGKLLGSELISTPAISDPTLRKLMEILWHEKQNSFRNGALFLDGVATAIATFLVTNFSTKPARREVFGGLAPRLLHRTIDLIESALDRDIHLEELARNAGLSSSHFIRSFRESTGMTPYQFVLTRRIERAKALMRSDDMSLTQIALATGFADQQHLAKTFRRLTSRTPTDYLRSL